MKHYSRPEEVLNHFYNLFLAQKGMLGLAYIATQDEDIIPEYPALAITVGSLTREDHGTQRFLVTFNASFWIYHANLDATHRQRTLEDMELTTRVVRFLHLPNNRRLDGRLITGSGRVTEEVPGILGGKVVATRLAWVGQAQVLYEDS